MQGRLLSSYCGTCFARPSRSLLRLRGAPLGWAAAREARRHSSSGVWKGERRLRWWLGAEQPRAVGEAEDDAATVHGCASVTESLPGVIIETAVS